MLDLDKLVRHVKQRADAYLVDSDEIFALIGELREDRRVLNAVYDGLMPDGTLPAPVFAQVVKALGKQHA